VTCSELLKRNPDNKDNYNMLIRAHKIDPFKDNYEDSELQTIIKILEGTFLINSVEEEELYPRSQVSLNLQLRYLKDEAFEKKFDEYIRKIVSRSIPSLFANVKPLYEDQKKVKIIEGIIVKHIESLKMNECFSGSDIPQDPTILLWLLLFAASHFDQQGDHTKALELITEAIEHTPTLVEAYTVKARIYKHMKDMTKAAETYEIASKMDQADRYLNSRCSKYLIRAGKIEEAEKMMAHFAREVNGELNVHEMQCMWYELEIGQEYEREGKLAKSFSMYRYIDQHFDTIYDDQFDYHYYALKKGNINSYIQMIKWEDNLYNHKYFLPGALGLMRCYLKANKIMEKTEKTGEESKELEDMKVKDPIEDGIKLATKALKYHANNKELQSMAAEVFTLKGMLLYQP
jgi:peptide alpha-N-acetyltransferase